MDRSFDILYYPDTRLPIMGGTILWVTLLIGMPFFGEWIGWTYETQVATGIVVAIGLVGGVLLLVSSDPWSRRFRTRVTLSDRIMTVGTTTYRYEDLWVRHSTELLGGTRLLTAHTVDGEIPLVRVQGTFAGRLGEFYHGRPRVSVEEFEEILSFFAERTQVRESYLNRYSVLMHPYK